MSRVTTNNYSYMHIKHIHLHTHDDSNIQIHMLWQLNSQSNHCYKSLWWVQQAFWLKNVWNAMSLPNKIFKKDTTAKDFIEFGDNWGVSCLGIASQICYILPSRELTYHPQKRHFWRWCSFSRGGICMDMLVSWSVIRKGWEEKST